MASPLRPLDQRSTPSLTASSRRVIVAVGMRPIQAEMQCFRAHRQTTIGTIQPEVCR